MPETTTARNRVPSIDAEGKIKPTPETAYSLYEKGLRFNNQIDLDETVKVNENFFIGKQWEGVISNGLPTPVFNIIKRVVLFTVATITTDNLKISAVPLVASPNTKDLAEPARIVTEEIEAVMERNRIPSLLREYCRDAAVRGDGCTYTYFDPDTETGQDAKGAIVTELVENTRVFFGNANSRDVQSQPWIIITRRALLDEIRAEARSAGAEDWDAIKADADFAGVDAAKHTDDKVTDVLLMWRDRKTREIWAYRCVKGCTVKKPWSLGIRLYPITWLNWDYIQDSYHGQSMVTGLAPNQIMINKLWAMTTHSLMTTAFPKIIYDKTRVLKWDNRVGAAIGINGGDVNSVAKNLDPAQIDAQVSMFIKLAVEQTESCLGATSVALGDTRPDNTSAIIALQRAAATPSELTKQNYAQSAEDLSRIYMEFMGECYGTRYVDIATPNEVQKAAQLAGEESPAEIPVLFDFGTLREIPMMMKIEAGASSYYSEIASIQTLDNLLMNGQITAVQYLERIPDGYVPDRRGLIAELKRMQATPTSPPSNPAQTPPNAAEAGQTPELPTGGGYHALQRKINEVGMSGGVA